jgi:hypothetical protein
VDTKYFGQFTGNCIAHLKENVISGLEKVKLQSLTADGISGMTANMFMIVLNRFSDALEKIFTKEKIAQVSQKVIYAFHYLWQTSQMQERNDILLSNDISSMSWMQISLSTNASAQYLNSNALNYNSNYADLGIQVDLRGLRSGHCDYISPDLFANLNNLAYFSDDFLSSISTEQAAKIPCGSFSSIKIQELKKFDPSTIENMTPHQ